MPVFRTAFLALDIDCFRVSREPDDSCTERFISLTFFSKSAIRSVVLALVAIAFSQSETLSSLSETLFSLSETFVLSLWVFRNQVFGFLLEFCLVCL